MDERGSEAWFIDLVTLDEPASWATWADEHGNPVAAVEWLDSPRDPAREWHPLRVKHRALGHLVLARMAAEVLEGYGRRAPGALLLTPRVEEQP